MTETSSSTAGPAGQEPTKPGQSDPGPEAGVPAAGTEAVPALAVRQVGHGTIRLREPASAQSVEAEAPAATPATPAPAPEPVGHGPIRFVHRSLELPLEATLAAEADILELLSTVS